MSILQLQGVALKKIMSRFYPTKKEHCMDLTWTSYNRTLESQDDTSKSWFECGPNFTADIPSSGPFLRTNSLLVSDIC